MAAAQGFGYGSDIIRPVGKADLQNESNMKAINTWRAGANAALEKLFGRL
jgi:hypothetical protein